MSKLATVLLCLAGLLLVGCGSSIEAPINEAAAQPVDPDGEYCLALQNLLIAQPSGAFEDEEMRVAMGFYADSVERLAELSSPEDALVLFELAATARLVGEEPDDRLQAQRLGSMFTPVAAITIRASRQCAIAG